MNVSVERCEGLRRSEMSSRRCRSLLAVGWAPATWNTGGNAVIRSHAGRVCAAAVRIHIQMTMYRSLSSQPCTARRVVQNSLNSVNLNFIFHDPMSVSPVPYYIP